MKLRIAYLINQYPKVTHSFIRREIKALERQGIEIHRIAIRGWKTEIVDEEDKLEQTLTRYVLQRGLLAIAISMILVMIASPRRFITSLGLTIQMGWRADRPLPYHLVYLAEACHILPWLKKADISHVHAHFGTNSTEVAMLTHALGGPSYSFTVHGPDEFDQPKSLKLSEKIRRSAFVIGISSYCRSQLFRCVAHEFWPKIKVIHCGLEPAFYEVPPATAPTNPRLVCVGRLCEQKGQLLLIEAAARLKEKDINFELILVGDGEIRPEVERLILHHGLQKIVRITGWLSSSEVRDQILASRGLVLPSFAEGLPVVIMEAMSLRRPALTTYVAGIPELVRHGENGWLFPPGSIKALVEAMEEILALPPERLAEIGEAARVRVLERHSVDKEAKKLASMFLGSFEKPLCDSDARLWQD